MLGNDLLFQQDPTARAERSGPAFIRVEDVRKTFAQRDGGGVPVLEKIDLTIAENEFFSLVGRSGCDKTTLLNMIAGLEDASSGKIAIAGYLKATNRIQGEAKDYTFTGPLKAASAAAVEVEGQRAP